MLGKFNYCFEQLKVGQLLKQTPLLLQIQTKAPMNSMNHENERDIQQEQFHIRLPKNKANRQLPNNEDGQRLSEKCWNIYQTILDKKKRQLFYVIARHCNYFSGEIRWWKRFDQQEEMKNTNARNYEDNYQKPRGKKKQQQKHEEQQKKQEPSKKVIRASKLIVPVCIRKNQTEYIEQFLDYFVEKLQKNIDGKQEKKQQIVEKNTNNQKFRSNLHQARQLNIFSKSGLKQVSRIALFMHRKLKQMHITQDISIYIARQVTDLSPSNLYILEEGLSEFNCIIIAPTYHSFQQALYVNITKNQIVPVKFFQHKSLFGKLMFETICDPQIMAYFPKESLKLLDDFDDFPISFKEGTQRLIYCIKKLQILRKRRHVKFHPVDIKTMLAAIQKSIGDIFMFFRSTDLTTQKYIRCILDEKQQFNVFDKYLSKNIYFTREEEGQKTEPELIKQLTESLISNIEKCQTIRIYSNLLKEKQVGFFRSKKNVSKDLKRLKINPDDNLDMKTLLELNLKEAISSLTKNIRQQAANFDWSDFEYMETIKPMLPYNIFNSVMTSNTHNQLIQFIYETLYMPLSTLVAEFCLLRKWDYGKLMYYMKDLELHGLIDVSENSMNPIISVSYFDTSSYRTRKQC